MFGVFASLGSILSLAAGILFIFFSIANFTIHQSVPRHIRIVSITTYGLGPALSTTLTGTAQTGFSNSSLYGNPSQPINQHNSGDGLRTVYSWGLWNRCAGYDRLSNLQYCTDRHWAYRFQPTASLLADVPNQYSSGLTSLLSTNAGRIKSDVYLGDWSRIAFYFLFVGVALLALMLIVGGGSSAGRGATCAALGLNFLVLAVTLIGTLIWTGIIAVLKKRLDHQTVSGSVPLGIEVQYGNAMWILWAINATLLLSFVPYLIACIVGRRRV